MPWKIFNARNCVEMQATSIPMIQEKHIDQSERVILAHMDWRAYQQVQPSYDKTDTPTSDKRTHFSSTQQWLRSFGAQLRSVEAGVLLYQG